MPQRILILGASARAAAHSARRGGYAPVAGDLFADADLAAVCSATKISRYPEEFVQVAEQSSAAVWMYTGSLENYPDVVDQISRNCKLLGNSGRVLARVRDPFCVAETLASHGVSVPTLKRGDRPPESGQWVRKPLRGSAGFQIKKWSCSRPPKAYSHPTSKREPTGGRFYFQQFIEGTSCSALFVAAAGQAALLGTTKQLVGPDWLAAGEFQYAGSIGPLRLENSAVAKLRAMGDCLAEQFDLSGLFGVDFILNKEGVWPLEVNPRYTASVEVLERALSFHAVALHVAATNGSPPEFPSAAEMRSSNLKACCGKAILYARRDTDLPTKAIDWARQRNADSTWPRFADLPTTPTRIPKRHPIATALTEGDSVDDVQSRLRSQWRDFMTHVDS